MSSSRSPRWRRTLRRLFPFLFQECPGGNYHWIWEGICYCQVNEFTDGWQGGACDLKTGEPLYIASQVDPLREKATKLGQLADACSDALYGGEHGWMRVDFDTFVSRCRQELSSDSPEPNEGKDYASRLREIQRELEEIHEEIGETATHHPFSDAWKAACLISDMAEYLEYQSNVETAEPQNEKTYTPKTAFQKIDNGVWMTTGWYTWRNRKTERGKHGQYLAFGEYPDCIRSTSAFTLENVLNVGENREWQRAEVNDRPEEHRFDPAGA